MVAKDVGITIARGADAALEVGETEALGTCFNGLVCAMRQRWRQRIWALPGAHTEGRHDRNGNPRGLTLYNLQHQRQQVGDAVQMLRQRSDAFRHICRLSARLLPSSALIQSPMCRSHAHL